MTTNAIGNVITSTYTTKPITLSTKSILNLIQAEFGTIFPNGARLGYSLHSGGFVVLDSTGNLILNVATNAADTNYSFSLSNGVSSGVISGKEVKTTTASATNTVLVATERVPDYGIYYVDGKTNKFHFTGLLTLKVNEDQTSTTNLFKSISILVSGPGGGSLFNPATGQYDQAVFTSGTWSASGVNIPD
jgi:hypothetical protein